MSNEFYVYSYESPNTGVPFYIGKGKGNRHIYHLLEAKKEHTADKNKHKISKIKKILASGKEPVINIVMGNMTEEDAFELEEFLIQEIGRADIGLGTLTNLSDGGEGGKGIDHKGEKNPMYGKEGYWKNKSHSKETKLKIAIAQKGRVFSEEHKEKMRKPKSEEGRNAIRKARLESQYKPSEETKLKTSLSLKGRVITDEHRAKISASNAGVPKPQKTCVYCGKVAAVHLISRWHDNNCRSKINE